MMLYLALFALEADARTDEYGQYTDPDDLHNAAIEAMRIEEELSVAKDTVTRLSRQLEDAQKKIKMLEATTDKEKLDAALADLKFEAPQGWSPLPRFGPPA